MILHHSSDATLIARAAGTLPPLHARVLDVHIAACPLCQDALHNLEEVGGAFLAALPPASLRPDALARTLARLDNEVTAAHEQPPAPTDLAGLATGRWWWLGPGIRLMPLVRRDTSGTRLDLIRVAPGVAMPGHRHTGREMTCIMQGGYIDETGHYDTHDIAEGDEDLQHTPIAATGPGCICLIATTGRLRGDTWLARFIQPLIDV
jgi:putative transcriptional regulator